MSRDRFRRSVDLLSQFGVVAVRDATPADQRAQLSPENVNVGNKTMFHPGVLFLDFTTEYNRDHVFLEDFQMHSRIMGVVGIADCAQVDNEDEQRRYLAECVTVFDEQVKRYPSSLVHQCIAFNPSKDLVAAPLKEITLIPNEGQQLSFYLATFINSFTSELLRGFTNLVKQIESRPVISGPTPPNYSVNVHRGSTANLNSSGTSKDDAISPTSGAAISNADRNKKRTPARAMKLVTDLYLMAGRIDLAIPSYETCLAAMKQNSDFVWWGATLESFQAAILLFIMNSANIGPLFILQSTPTTKQGEILLHFPTITSILTSPALLTHRPLRAFLAETPDRHREILQVYDYALTTAPSQNLSPIPILSAALCIRVAKVLKGMVQFGFAEYLVKGAALPFISGLDPDASTTTSTTSSGGAPTGSGAQPNAPAAAQAASGDRIQFNNGIGANKLDVHTWLMKANQFVSTMGRDYMALSDRVWVYANIAAVYGAMGFRRKHAFFLREMNLVVSETLRPSLYNGLSGTRRGRGRMSDRDQADGDAVVPPVMDSWKRDSTINLEEGEGELRFATEMDNTRGKMDDQKEDGILGKQILPPNGVIQSYKRVCEVFGLKIRSYKARVPNTGFLHPAFSDDEDEWLDEFDNEDDLQKDAKKNQVAKAVGTAAPVAAKVSQQNLKPAVTSNTPASRTTSLKNLAVVNSSVPLQSDLVPTRIGGSRIRYGWPVLQIQVLKECIHVAEAVDDHPYTIYFIIRLLRRLKRHLPPSDQHDLADRLEAVILKTLAVSAHRNQPEMLSPVSGDSPRRIDRVGGSSEDATMLPVMVRGVAGGVAGIPVLRKMEIVGQPQRLVPLTHPMSWLQSGRDSKATPKELFLYNPTAEKGKKKKVTLVVNELAYVDLVFANPFAFELDLKSVTLTTTGINFKPKPISTVIPPFSRSHIVRVYGTPLESGNLEVHGCTVKMFGGCLEEELYPLKKALDDPKRKQKDGKRKKQDERERFGKRPVHAHVVKHDVKPAAPGPDRSWSVPMEVVPQLPLLNVVKGSGIGLGALMMFEGERTRFTLELENIGPIPINYLRVSFVETIAQGEPLAQDALEKVETIYERDIYEHHIRAFWLENSEGDSHSEGRGAGYFARVGPPKALEKIDVNLKTGDKITVDIGVFGKKLCTGGTIVFEYGNVTYPEDISNTENADFFYCRQAIVPIILSVEKPLALHNISVFNINNREAAVAVKDRDISRAISLEDLVIDQSALALRDSVVGINEGRRLNSDHFILSFDLQNVWTLPFEVSFDIYDDAEVNSLPVTISAYLYPGTTKRIILPIKRIYLPESQTILPIPLPTWKQFVVGRIEKLSYQEDKFQRLAFWLREALVGFGVGGAPQIDPTTGDYTSDLVCGGSPEDGTVGAYGRVVVRWTCGRGRSGRLLAVRDLQLFDEEMAKAVLQEEVSITATATEWDGSKLAGDSIFGVPRPKAGNDIGLEHGRIRVKMQDFVSFEWKLVNNRFTPITLCLRVQPIFGNINALETNMDDRSGSCDGRVVYSGVLESPLPIQLEPRVGSTSHKISFMFLSRGVYTLVAHAEEVGRIGDPENVPKKKSKKDKEVDAVALGLVGSAGSLFWGREVVIVEVY
ncbi:hypothetical protein HDU79_008223 [Rhizoclosmatium sp. JEL0117]|nr:hypothetical protein HDU79_008223 [Rhizoclosmatium sp. JEL0117]